MPPPYFLHFLEKAGQNKAKITNCVKKQEETKCCECYIFFPGLFFIIFSYYCSFMVVWGLGFGGWGLILGFWGWGFQLMGFGACGVGPSGFLGFGLSI